MTSRGIEAFLFYLRETEQRYSLAEADEQEANAETQDILHNIELQEHNYHEFARLSKALKECRQKRRLAKDTKAETVPVLDWIENNRAVIKALERILGDVRKAEKNADNRIYTPRSTKRGD